MYTQVEKPKENKNRAVARFVAQKNNTSQGIGFVDNRPDTIAQRKLQEMANNSPQSKQDGQLSNVIQMATSVDYSSQTVKYSTGPYSGLKNASVGKKMTATLDPGDPIKGSTPQLGGNEQELYDTLNASYGNQYVRGHLLNDNVGGLGVAENLFPLTDSANHAHLEQSETMVKALLVNDKTVEYEAKASQDSVGADFRLYPKSKLAWEISTGGQNLASWSIPIEPDVGTWGLNKELENKGFGSSGAGIAPSRNEKNWITTGIKAGYFEKHTGKKIAESDLDHYW